MTTLQGKDIYLNTLERADCKTLWQNSEYDMNCRAEPFCIGLSDEGADKWFDEIQAAQGKTHVRLGIFLNDGTVVGDVALQDIDWQNSACTIGMGMAKIAHRGKGYGQQAVRLMLAYGFTFLGMARISAETLDINIAAQKSLIKCGFTQEGRDRSAVYCGGARHDRLRYSILRDEFARISAQTGNA